MTITEAFNGAVEHAAEYGNLAISSDLHLLDVDSKIKLIRADGRGLLADQYEWFYNRYNGDQAKIDAVAGNWAF